MTRWIMIALTLIGLVAALLTHSPAVLGFALLALLGGLFGTVMSLAADRISASSRPDVAMLPPEALKAIRDKANARQDVVRQRAEASRSATATNSKSGMS